MAKSKTKKIIMAGLLRVEAIYPRVEARDGDRARAAKRKASSEAQKRLNAIHSWQKLEYGLAENYRHGDLWITVTYDDAHLPKTRAQARRRFLYFLQKLQKERKAQGREAVVFWNTEHKHRDEDHWMDARWHHHFFLNATGDDYELVRRLWTYGSNVYIEQLHIDREHSYEALARYMCKESQDKVGQHCWCCTRNARKPEIRTVRVESDEQLQIPRGALALRNESGDDYEFAKWRVVKYLLPGWDRAPKVRARRRKR